MFIHETHLGLLTRYILFNGWEFVQITRNNEDLNLPKGCGDTLDHRSKKWRFKFLLFKFELRNGMRRSNNQNAPPTRLTQHVENRSQTMVKLIKLLISRREATVIWKATIGIGATSKDADVIQMVCAYVVPCCHLFFIL